MEMQTRKLLTNITEAVLEGTLIRGIQRSGAPGRAVVDARGKGTRGVRAAGRKANTSIRVEAICDEPKALVIIANSWKGAAETTPCLSF